MKTQILLTFIGLGLLTSPVVKAEPPVVVEHGNTTVVAPGVWGTVPDDYEGDYYLYDGHYYHGGKYEHGNYESDGKHYSDRYMHDGKWIYGGKWEHHAKKEARKDAKEGR